VKYCLEHPGKEVCVCMCVCVYVCERSCVRCVGVVVCVWGGELVC